jgi:iron complex transport system ATP-binding protein
MVGLEKNYQGKILLDHRCLRTYQTKELAQKIAIVLSHKVDIPYLRVYETVALGRSPYLNWLGQMTAHDKKIVEQALEITETNSFANRFLHTLSDGERQRVMIARAIAQESPMIILDEPTAFLDVYYRKQTIALLHKIATQQEKCILLSTHEVDLAIAYAHQFLLLNLTRQNLFARLGEIDEKAIYDFLEVPTPAK